MYATEPIYSAGTASPDPITRMAIESFEVWLRKELEECAGMVATVNAASNLVRAIPGFPSSETDDARAVASWNWGLMAEAVRVAGKAIGHDFTGLLREPFAVPGLGQFTVASNDEPPIDHERVAAQLRATNGADYQPPTIDKFATAMVNVFESRKAVAAELARMKRR